MEFYDVPYIGNFRKSQLTKSIIFQRGGLNHQPATVSVMFGAAGNAECLRASDLRGKGERSWCGDSLRISRRLGPL